MKKFFVVYNSLCMALILMTSANAYIDPSVMTYMIQAVAGIAVAVGASVGIFWRKAKREAKEKLGVDFEGKKETEEDVVAFDETTETGTTDGNP